MNELRGEVRWTARHQAVEISYWTCKQNGAHPFILDIHSSAPSLVWAYSQISYLLSPVPFPPQDHLSTPHHPRTTMLTFEPTDTYPQVQTSHPYPAEDPPAYPHPDQTDQLNPSLPAYSPIDGPALRTPRDPLLAAAMRDFAASQDPLQWGTRDQRIEARRVQEMLTQMQRTPRAEGWLEWFFNLIAIPEDQLRYQAMLDRPVWASGYGGLI